jgi:hypothetical protein
MLSHRVLRTYLTAFLMAVAMGQSARAATLATPFAPTPVATFDGMTVLSRFDWSVHLYRLSLLTARGTRTLPVPPRPVPFDADIGPDARGRPTIVYSRCRREPPNVSISGPLPAYRQGVACRLYELDVSSRHERRIPGLGRRPSSFLPTIWRTRLAWAESVDPGTTGHEPEPTLMLKESGRAARRIPGGTPPNRNTSAVPQPGPRSLDLRGRHIVFTWYYNPRRDDCGRAAKGGPMANSEVWLYTIGRSTRRIARAGCPEDGDTARIEWAGFGSGTVEYAVTRSGPPFPAFVRRVPFGGRGPTEEAPVPLPASDFLVSFTDLGTGEFAYSVAGATESLLAAQLTFAPRAPGPTTASDRGSAEARRTHSGAVAFHIG